MSASNKSKNRGRGRAKARQDSTPLTQPGHVTEDLERLSIASGSGEQKKAPVSQPQKSSQQFQDAEKGQQKAVKEPQKAGGPPGPAAEKEPQKEVVPVIRHQLARRPGYGTNSVRNIPLLANYFSLKLPTGVVYQYDVDIVQETKPKPEDKKSKGKPPPTRLPPRLTKDIFNKLVKENKAFARHHPVYDGNKTLLTKFPLDDVVKQTNFEVILLEGARQSKFFVTVKPALTAHGRKGEVNLDSLHKYMAKKQGERPLDAIRAMDLIFHHGPMMMLAPVGRSFFIKPTKDEDLPPFGGGREIWFGYTQSVRPAEWGPLLNVDITATVFYKEGPILNFVNEVLGFPLGSRNLDPGTFKKLSKEVTGLRVRTVHSPIPRKYTIAGLSSKNATEITFKLDGPEHGGKQVTIEKYFHQQYNYRLQFPNLPCLQVQPKTKNTYIPMEVCVMLSEQHCKRRLTESQTASMIRKTCKTPQERFREIKGRLEETRKHSAPYLDYFGIGLGTEFVQVNSRVLSPPAVVYAQPDCFVPDKGAWNIADHKFFKAVEIDHWLVMNYGNCREDELRRFADMLMREGTRLGMKIKPVQDIKNLRNERRLGAEEILRRSKKMYPDLQMVVLVIPGRSDMSNYAEIKKAGDTELGLVTQCIKDVNVSRKCNPSLLGNLCQKINAKLGGINNAVAPKLQFKVPQLFDEPVLVFGADVTHPSPGDHSPSVAAVVGSLDRYPSRFAARVRVQKSTLGGIQSRVELILELKIMVKDLLLQFHRETGQKPQRLYFLRDGVSETQFPEVLNYEVNQIRQACMSLSPSYKPGLTFLCVQKRHHTRFCPKNSRDGCGKAGNIPPGTTVDTSIVSPLDFDFFLCSHFGLQGTSRPTHYTVLLDENNLSADQVQALCYHLCHTYARCTRSLSIPAPVQYAHLAAFRARSHLAQVCDFSSGASSTGSSTGEVSYENEAAIEKAVQVVSEQLNKMYFV